MRFGLVLPIQAQGIDLTELTDELAEEVAAAEVAGFDAFFLPEFHQARGGALVSPMVVGAALLTGTSRIRFGQCVLALPLHHPVRLAEDLLMVDWLSGGRVMLGVGVGHQRPDFAAYGVSHRERHLFFEEALQIVRHCLEPGPFSFEGRFFTVEADITPQPRTTPRPPIWVGAHSDTGLARAARLGDVWVSDPQRDIATIARLARTYRRAREEAGQPVSVALFREAWIGEDRRACEREWGPHAVAMHRLYFNVGAYQRMFEPWVDEVQDRAEFTIERLAPGRFLYGNGDEIRAEVMEWSSRTGAEYFALRMRHPGGPSHVRTLEAISRFGAEVIEPLSRRGAA